MRAIKNLIKHTMVLVILFGFLNFISTREADIRYDVAPHVVSFNSLIMNNARFATGFHLKYKGEVYIMTNKHVCDLQRQIYNHDHIQFEDYVGEIIAVDTVHDLCLVTSNRKEGLSLANTPVEVMDEITIVGFPRGLPKTIRKGHVTAYIEILAPWISRVPVETFSISAIAYGGNSGSPVVNKYGQVVGVLFAGPMQYMTEAEIVPLFYVNSFLETVLGE